MGTLTTFLVCTIAVQYGYTLASKPLTFPSNYHFNAEDIDLSTGIVKPFEIWYSSEYNITRLDMFNGVVSRYYHQMNYDELHQKITGDIYMYYSKVAKDDSSIVTACDMVKSYSFDFEDFLSPLRDFTYSGEKDHDGKKAQVWTRDMISRIDTMLVQELGDGVAIPLHYTIKELDLKDGSVSKEKAINYYNFKSDIKLEDLNRTHSKCKPFKSHISDLDDDATSKLHPSIPSDVDIAFQLFKNHHGRLYEDDIHHYRKAIFKKNWELIVEHNKKNLSYKLGINQFADKSMSELNYLFGVKSVSLEEGTYPFPYTETELEAMADEFPESYDMRIEGLISPVRNQAHCGSCWAFAAAATLEGAFAKFNGGKILDLSEQSLVDCAWPYNCFGCHGASIDSSYKYLMAHGIPTVAEYGPYIEENGYCKINNMTSVYHIKGYSAVTRNSPNAMKATLLKYGPVTIGVRASDLMKFYKSGVFYDFECQNIKPNHAMTVVGYGIRDGELYWIVKNSWGESWGASGYILMSVDNDNCDVMHSPFFPIL